MKSHGLVDLLSLLWWTVQSIRAHDRPNILLVVLDDSGYGDVGLNWDISEHSNTPTIDALASQGLSFTNFYAGAPVCTPSRAAMLTGRYGKRTGVSRHLGPHSTGGLPASEVTFALALKAAGYRTAMFGKWHLGHESPHLPTDHGFDHWLGLPYSNDMGCTTDPLGIPQAATKSCADLKLRGHSGHRKGASSTSPLTHSSLQSRRFLKAASSNEESSSALPIMQSVAVHSTSFDCRTPTGAATDAATGGAVLGFGMCASTNEIVESPANLWNLTAKMVDFGVAFIEDRLDSFHYTNAPQSFAMNEDSALQNSPSKKKLEKKRKQSPWLLLAALTEPHVPHSPLELWPERYSEVAAEGLKHFNSNVKEFPPGSVYAAAMRQADHAVARLCAAVANVASSSSSHDIFSSSKRSSRSHGTINRITNEEDDPLLCGGANANTLSIVTSDNGPWRQWGPYGGSGGAFRGGKFEATEGGLRVFAVFHWPGRILTGKDSNCASFSSHSSSSSHIGSSNSGSRISLDGAETQQEVIPQPIRRGAAAADVDKAGGRWTGVLASLMDLFPTLLHLGRAHLPDHFHSNRVVDGVNLTAVLLATEKEAVCNDNLVHRDFLFLQGMSGSLAALRVGRYKLVDLHPRLLDSTSKKTLTVYDLSADPGELAPLLPEAKVTLPHLQPNLLQHALHHGTESLKLKPTIRSSSSSFSSIGSSSISKQETVQYERLELARFGLALSDALGSSIKREAPDAFEGKVLRAKSAKGGSKKSRKGGRSSG